MANFRDFSDPKNLNEFRTVAGAQWWFEKLKSSSSVLMGHIFEKQTRSELKTSVLSVNMAKNTYRKTCRTVKYHCDFTYVNHKNPFLEHCIGVPSVSMRSCQIWTSKIASARWDQALANWRSTFLIKGMKRERRAAVCSTLICRCRLCESDCSNFFPVKNWHFLLWEMILSGRNGNFWAGSVPEMGKTQRQLET